MGKRRKARELVMKYLYQYEFNHDGKEEDIDFFFREMTIDKELEVFSKKLIIETLSKMSDIDIVLKKFVDNWDISRIAAIDRNILRMAACEMIYFDDIPPIVSINEAVDIAKKYSTSESGKFVNGILDKIKHDLIDKDA
ncbi:MAG: transcription antitermination factor NusB [Candidatus Ancaeobacter aquaticus]|nr:transcription antitermination factor NusB [Candidatus Ancaeobacter aquaticus]